MGKEAISPNQKYTKLKEEYSKEASYYASSVNKIGNIRLLIALIGLASTLYLHLHFIPIYTIISFLVFCSMFILLVVKHRTYIEKRDYARTLCSINEEALNRINGNWSDFEDKGSEFIKEEHHYTQDLDIFGQGSLFQWINTTTTYTGRIWLSHLLSVPCSNIEEIYARQEGILELADRLDWRQRFMAEGRMTYNKNPSEFKDPDSLYSWANQKTPIYLKTWLIIGVRILPIITLILILLSFFTTKSYFLAIFMIGVQIALLIPGYSNRVKEFTITNSFNEKLKSYKNMLIMLEQDKFESKLITDLQQSLKVKEISNRNQTASQQLTQLEKIVDAISHRSGQLYIIFNILFLLDYQFQIALEQWKYRSGNKIKHWFQVIGKIEAYSSIANIRYDHPNWVIPVITEKPGTYIAKDLGHPLIVENRVCNDIKINPPTNTLLITGSNMSGKSTLLRTSGINLILAYIGAPVCAASYKVSLMKVYSCMRISDNLDKNLSSFYAELLRIKDIVKTAEREHVFFLLDEIFKGTNSRDRHIGAKAVIKKLQKEGGLGLVSTHDLELGKLETKNSGVENYHFREYYQDGQIGFDYILRPGISPTTNAVYLMNMAGIEPDID